MRTPSSRRTGPAWRIAGWWAGANRKPKPTSSMHSADLLVRASIGDAERLEHVGRAPQREDARGCRAWRPPHPARGRDERRRGRDVERARAVAARAGRCPRGRRGAGRTSTTCARIAAAAPTISSTVSPLARSATSRPAICAGVASPRITSPDRGFGAACTEASPRQQPVDRVGDHAALLMARKFRAITSPAGVEHRLRMELHPVQVGDVAMAEGHDLAVPVARGGDQHVGQRLDRRERVVAARLEGVGEAVEQAVVPMRSTVPTLPCISRRARSTTPP